MFLTGAVDLDEGGHLKCNERIKKKTGKKCLKAQKMYRIADISVHWESASRDDDQFELGHSQENHLQDQHLRTMNRLPDEPDLSNDIKYYTEWDLGQLVCDISSTSKLVRCTT